MAATSLIFTIIFRIWQLHYSFSLWDEGYLWYGIQRVAQGEVPMRDFMAYDPARYYIYAALAAMFGGHGLLDLRLGITLVQAIAVFAGLWVVVAATQRRNIIYWLLIVATLSAWMQPYSKPLDFLLCALLVAALSYLAQRPNRTGHLLAGLCVGLAAVLGRDHGIYGVVASVGVMLWHAIRPGEGIGLIKGFTIWALGVIIGFTPMLLMMALVPGFALTMWESIRLMFEYGSTNIARPVPWPWLINPMAPLPETIRTITTGLFFIAVIAFCVIAVAWVVAQRIRHRPTPPVLVGAAFMAVPYAHYAFSRADTFHLVISMYPVMIACLVILGTKPARICYPLVAILCAVSLWTLAPMQTAWQCERNRKCVNTEISGDVFTIDPQTAADIALLHTLAAKYALNGRPFVAVPFWPGAYAVLDRPSPLWEIYPLFPRSAAFEQAEIARMKVANPGFAVIVNANLDGREDFRFQNTHKLTYQYIVDHFDRVDDPAHPNYEIFKSRDNAHDPGT